MDFERLERAWNGPANSTSEAASAYVTETMMQALRRRRQAAAGFSAFVGIVLVFWTAVIIFRIAMAPFPFDMAREWAVLPLSILPWAGLVAINRQQRRHRLAHPDPYASVPATLRALLDENATARQRLRVVGGLMLVTVIVGAVALRQLVAVGKMTPANVMQASVVLVAIMAAIGAYRVWHYVRVLRPQGKRLERLLADYSAAG